MVWRAGVLLMQGHRPQGHAVYCSLMTVKECDQLNVGVHREAIKAKMLQLCPREILDHLGQSQT